MADSTQRLFASLRPEDPRRIREFRRRLGSLKWDAENANASLKELFDAVDELADAEIHYFLAGAASCLAANSLFGGTSGHVRFVSTQLELERLVTKARIDWCAFLAQAKADTDHIKAGFAHESAVQAARHPKD